MKTFIRLTLFLFGFLVLVGSCKKKYPEGPLLSLRTKKARMVNVWRIEKYIVNDQDQTADFNTLYPNYTLTIGKDDKYSISINNNDSIIEKGRWYLAGEKDVVKFLPDGNTIWIGGAEVWQILKLKDKEVWGEYTDYSFSQKVEVHLTEK
ncbi:MAG: hypothetical protein ACRCYO_04575 [Bacteroidia bacterium]